jgi:glutamine synthetase
MSPNIIAQYLEKNPEEFTKEDLIKYIEGNEIRMVNFRFVGGDGRLKTINFIINSKAHLDQLLSAGERVDGSSLFSYIDSTSSDLYVIPRYKTQVMDPGYQVLRKILLERLIRL